MIKLNILGNGGTEKRWPAQNFQDLHRSREEALFEIASLFAGADGINATIEDVEQVDDLDGSVTTIKIMASVLGGDEYLYVYTGDGLDLVVAADVCQNYYLATGNASLTYTARRKKRPSPARNSLTC